MSKEELLHVYVLFIHREEKWYSVSPRRLTEGRIVWVMATGTSGAAPSLEARSPCEVCTTTRPWQASSVGRCVLLGLSFPQIPALNQRVRPEALAQGLKKPLSSSSSGRRQEGSWLQGYLAGHSPLHVLPSGLQGLGSPAPPRHTM